MLKKAFQVQVEIEIQAVSCPGVWLCPNGNVSLQLYMLGSCIQTSSVEPIFPLFYQEKFIFYKTFFTVQKLIGLQKVLNKELLYIELIQWQNSDVGNVLATFQTTLTELLFPGKKDGMLVGFDIDLLMEPMECFPGILAPKVEVSTKTVIEEKLFSSNETKCPSYVVNPCTIQTKTGNSQVVRQRKVCHTAKYHKSSKCSNECRNNVERPPFVVRKVDENLLHRKPDGIDINTYCNCKKSPTRKPEKLSEYCRAKSIDRLNVLKSYSNRGICECGMYNQRNCPVCSKYKHYFNSNAPSIKSMKYSRPLFDDVDDDRRCPCEDPTNNNVCNYSPQLRKTSLAQKIHNRLTDTLGQCSTDSYSLRNCSEKACDVCTLEDSTCTMSSFGNFYKKMYKKANEKCENYVNCL